MIKFGKKTLLEESEEYKDEELRKMNRLRRCMNIIKRKKIHSIGNPRKRRKRGEKMLSGL